MVQVTDTTGGAALEPLKLSRLFHARRMLAQKLEDL